MRTDAEIRLLTEMLAEDFREEAQPSSNRSACPAPALLWALFEASTDETAWTQHMREHVGTCVECGSLMKHLQGFVAASDDRSSIPGEYEAAWELAEKRMERKIQDRLSLHTRPRQVAWWKFEWLPPMAIVYTLGGCAAVLLLCGTTLYFARDRQDAASNQLAQSEADIWTRPTAQGAGAGRQVAPEVPDESSSESADKGVEPVAVPQPVPVAPAAADAGGRPAAADGAPAGVVATAAEDARAAGHRLSIELDTGMQASVQVLLTRREGNNTIVEASLTPASAGLPSVLFSARIEEGSGPVRLRIHGLELDGRRMNLNNGDVSSVTVRWPDSERRPQPGQSFEVQVLSGATLQGEDEKK